MIGILEHIDGRKLTIDKQTVYLRKGFDANTLLPLLQANVDVQTVEEKGFQMVEAIVLADIQPYAKRQDIAEFEKPSLPVTAVEKTKPVDMAPSANIPALNFAKSQGSFTTTTGTNATSTVKVTYNGSIRTQKDVDIMRQWSMGATLNSPALAQCNDALALSTQQTIERAKRIAEELLKWVVTR